MKLYVYELSVKNKPIDERDREKIESYIEGLTGEHANVRGHTERVEEIDDDEA